MKKICCLVFSLFAFSAYCQNSPPPPGCGIYGVIDTDNDGYAQFETGWFINNYYPAYLTEQYGFDLSGYTLEWSTAIGAVHTNAFQNEEFLFINFIYSGSGPYYEALDISAAYYNCVSLMPLPANGDLDNDDITNTNEDLNGNGNLLDDDSDNDLVANFLDTDPPLSKATNTLSAFSIAPNPAAGIVTISFRQNTIGNFKISLYDASGKLVIEKENTKTLNTAGLASGIYLVSIKTDNAIFSQQLMVK